VQITQSAFASLTGDIVDFWSLGRNSYWNDAHSRVIDAILAKVRDGTRVIYVPGNHDEALHDYLGASFGNIRVMNPKAEMFALINGYDATKDAASANKLLLGLLKAELDKYTSKDKNCHFIHPDDAAAGSMAPFARPVCGYLGNILG